jgi:hypothetical protein
MNWRNLLIVHVMVRDSLARLGMLSMAPLTVPLRIRTTYDLIDLGSPAVYFGMTWRVYEFGPVYMDGRREVFTF